ncbi:salivary glue protein Sgs-3-like [Neodiprion pinetum]|uniref:salivary glue protein Sgs-3-like n=1 Tax=Neodiprion pinetum TaxID=441929 RepID=UPI0037161F7C
MTDRQPKIPHLMSLQLTRPTTATTDTQTNRERTPLLQTPGQAPHPHRYGREGTHQTETRRTLLPTPTTHTQVTKKATTATHTTTTAPTTTQRHPQTRTPTITHTVTLSGPVQCPKCNGLVRGTKYSQRIQTCTQTNTDTQHPPTVTQTTRTTTTHTMTHPLTNKQTPHTTTHPTPTPTPRHTQPRHTLLPASPPSWTHTRLRRPQTTEQRIIEAFDNVNTLTEPTHTRQTDRKHLEPTPEIIAIIANLQALSTLDEEIQADRDKHMIRRANKRTNTDETEASTSTHQPHITHQTVPHKTHPSNTPDTDTDTDTDSTTSTADTVIHIETTHTTTQETQTTVDETQTITPTPPHSPTQTNRHKHPNQPHTQHGTQDDTKKEKQYANRKRNKTENTK